MAAREPFTDLQPMRWWAALLQVLIALVAVLLLISVMILITRSMLLSVLGTPLSLIVLTFLLHRRGETWAMIGLRRPHAWPVAAAQGVAIAATVLGVLLGIELAIAPFFEAPAETFLDSVRGNTWVYLYFVGVVSWLSQGLGEELLFRGFIMTRLAQMLGLRGNAWPLAVAGQGILFGLMHSYQGVPGMISTAGAGMVFGGAYLVTERNLWPCMIAHALCGTILISFAYFGWV